MRFLTRSTLGLAAVAALGLAVAGCGKPKVKCSRLCGKMSDCAFELMKKQGKLSKSTVKMIKKSDSLRKRMKKLMRTECKKKCGKYNKKGKWSRKDVKRIKKCTAKGSCSKFAKCVTKYMY